MLLFLDYCQNKYISVSFMGISEASRKAIAAVSDKLVLLYGQ